MCISEQTVFMMDTDVAALSAIFLSELLRDENAAENAVRLEEPIGYSSNSSTRAGNCEQTA